MIKLPPVMLPTAEILPPVTLPVAEIKLLVVILPPENMLPADMFPALTVVRVVAPVTLSTPVAEISPPVSMLPPVTLPLALTTPVTKAPVVANTATFDVPPMLTLALPPELAIVMLDVPLTIFELLPVAMPVSRDPLPRI